VITSSDKRSRLPKLPSPPPKLADVEDALYAYLRQSNLTPAYTHELVRQILTWRPEDRDDSYTNYHALLTGSSPQLDAEDKPKFVAFVRSDRLNDFIRVYAGSTANIFLVDLRWVAFLHGESRKSLNTLEEEEAEKEGVL
jgi:hypothetical protein